jgi:nucleoside 2-deoxyribosyltransferase
MSSKVYICGPISGLPDDNKPAFEAAEKIIRERGFQPINPHVLCFDIVLAHEGTPEELWKKCMKRDISYMLDCDLVVLLNGWHKSRGAMVEINTASAVGIQCITIKEFLAFYAPVQD